jgi:peptide/nickel transport system substrate-binding protein
LPFGVLIMFAVFANVMIRDSIEGKTLPPEVVAVAGRAWPSLERVEAVDKYTVRFVNRTPDVAMEGRIARMGSEIISQRGFAEARTWIDWARKPITAGPFKVREFLPDQSLTLDAHDDCWGDRPPVKTLRFVVVPEVASRIHGLLSGQFDFICDLPPDQIAGVEKNAKFEVLGGLPGAASKLKLQREFNEIDPLCRAGLPQESPGEKCAYMAVSAMLGENLVSSIQR